MFVTEPELFIFTYKRLDQIAPKQIQLKKITGDFKNMIDKNFKLIELEFIGRGCRGKVINCFDKKRWKFYAMKL